VAAELLARLLRRGGDDLDAALALARGEEVAPERRERLRRAGVVRGGRRRRAILPPALIAPLLALDRALANSRFRVIADLYALLRRSRSRNQRELVLDALAEELEAERARLREAEGAPSAGELVGLMEDLRSSLEELRHEDASPQRVMRVSELAAEIVELLAERLTERRPRRKRRPRRANADQLAAACSGLAAIRPPRPGYVPSAEQLAAALRRPAAPPRSLARPAPTLRAQRERRGDLEAALKAPDPLLALYGEVSAVEALARHAALAQGGRELFERFGLISGRELVAIGELEAASVIEAKQGDLERAAA